MFRLFVLCLFFFFFCICFFVFFCFVLFFFQAEDGIRDLVRSRGLGDVYKRQAEAHRHGIRIIFDLVPNHVYEHNERYITHRNDRWFNDGPDGCCLLYTSDAADERSSVDLGGRRIIKKKKNLSLKKN